MFVFLDNTCHEMEGIDTIERGLAESVPDYAMAQHSTPGWTQEPGEAGDLVEIGPNSRPLATDMMLVWDRHDQEIVTDWISMICEPNTGFFQPKQTGICAGSMVVVSPDS